MSLRAPDEIELEIQRKMGESHYFDCQQKRFDVESDFIKGDLTALSLINRFHDDFDEDCGLTFFHSEPELKKTIEEVGLDTYLEQLKDWHSKDQDSRTVKDLFESGIQIIVPHGTPKYIHQLLKVLIYYYCGSSYSGKVDVIEARFPKTEIEDEIY